MMTILPEAFAAGVREALACPAAASVVARLWDKDAGLWSDDPAIQQRIRGRLGWLSMASVMASRTSEIQAAAEDIQRAGFTHAVLLGMGGSSLFAEVCRSTCGVAAGWLDLVVLDTTDPSAITAAQARAPLDRTLFIVSSKSGATAESSALCDYFYEQVRALKGERAGEQFVAITDAGTPLEALARQRAFRRAFVHGPSTGLDVGGRFSALTYFGLVPAALMGLDIQQLLSRAQAMAEACRPSSTTAANPGAQLAAALALALEAGQDKILFVGSPPRARFGVWAEQLVAESTGKSGKGLIPVDGETLRDPAAASKDRLVVELQMGRERDERLKRQVDGYGAAGHPVIRLQWRDPYDVGGEVVRWFVATALVAHAMQINPFDEPNVKESKDRTVALLDRYARARSLPEDAPVLRDEGIAVYGGQATDSLTAALRAWRAQIRAGDYVAVLSFLPRTPALDRAVESLRVRVSDATGMVTMLGYGPRYLHSTGQLHKGGPDRVVLLLLTSDDPVDVPVPGRPYTFSVLKRAQALGDFAALSERRRRVIRLHLGSAPESGMQRLLQAIG